MLFISTGGPVGMMQTPKFKDCSLASVKNFSKVCHAKNFYLKIKLHKATFVHAKACHSSDPKTLRLIVHDPNHWGIPAF